MATYYKTERICLECAEPFWGTAGANFCSAACRSRDWRMRQARERSEALGALCEEVTARRQAGRGSYSKLLPRLLRAVATELRQRGRDPIQILSGAPQDPITDHDDSPGGIEGTAPHRWKWLHPPERELQMLDQAIAERGARGTTTDWYETRRAQLLKAIKDAASD